MNAKHAYEQLIEIYQDKFAAYHRESSERKRHTDDVVVWIAGLSTAAIALILSSIKAPLVDVVFLKVSVGLFLLSLISAVVYRSYYYSLGEWEASAFLSFQGYCFGVSLEIYGPIEITDDLTKEQIAESLKEDLGQNFDNWLENENITRDLWVQLYNNWAELWDRQEQEGLKNLGRAFAPLAGKEPNETEKLFLSPIEETSLGKGIARLRKLSFLAYNLTTLFFVLAVTCIAFGFFIEEAIELNLHSSDAAKTQVASDENVTNYFQQSRSEDSPDYTIQQKGITEPIHWDQVITVHGFVDDSEMAQRLVNNLNGSGPRIYRAVPINK